MLNAASIQASLHFTLHLQADNEVVLERMIEQGVQLHQFPNEVLQKLKALSSEVLEETCGKDDFSREVMASYQAFLDRMSKWGPMSGSALWKWRK